MKIRVLDATPEHADVAVGENDEQITFTFRKTKKGIRKTATEKARREMRTWVPREDFMNAYRAAIDAIVQAGREKKDPFFLNKKMGER